MSAIETQPSADRVGFVYRSGSGNETRDVELPFRVLVLGSFTTQQDEFDNEKPITVTSRTLDHVMRSLKIKLTFTVPNRLLGDPDQPLVVDLPLGAMADFHPQQVISRVPAINDLTVVISLLEYLRDSGRDKKRMEFFRVQLSDSEKIMEQLRGNGIDINSLDDLDRDAIGYFLVELRRRIGEQLDEILHHEEFARLESAWRSLKFLVDRTYVDENCTTELLSVGKDALITDFEDVPEITHSRLFSMVYGSEFGQFGGRPYGVIIGNYEFGPGSRDVKLAQQLAAIANMAHAPFIGGADPTMFDVDKFADLSRLRDFNSLFEQERFAKWKSFRRSEDARYFALVLPRFQVRKMYGTEPAEEDSFYYKESLSHGASTGMWGNSAFAFATRLVDSFAKYRWCINVTGEEDGKVEGLNMEKVDGAVSGMRIPTQVLISDRQERELISHGFIPLSIHKGSDMAAFYASNSVIASKQFSNDQKGKEAGLSYHIGAQLQYLFITCRIAHYLKMMQREHIGSWKNKGEVERELNEWLRQYVSDMDNPTASIRARRPLRRARIMVNDLEDRHDWYVIDILITPHLKYMGTSFTLEGAGRLDKH